MDKLTAYVSLVLGVLAIILLFLYAIGEISTDTPDWIITSVVAIVYICYGLYKVRKLK